MNTADETIGGVLTMPEALAERQLQEGQVLRRCWDGPVNARTDLYCLTNDCRKDRPQAPLEKYAARADARRERMPIDWQLKRIAATFRYLQNQGYDLGPDGRELVDIDNSIREEHR